MTYLYTCDGCGASFEISKLMSEASRGERCPECMLPLIRIYTSPTISIPETSAVDVLNRHARGEGDPAPGMTQAQTVQAAKLLAQQKPRDDGAVHPQRSYPGQPARNYYGAD